MIVSGLDRESRFPWEVIEKMRLLNFFSLQIPRDYGGAELNSISYAITVEELSRVCAAVGLCVTVHNSVGATRPVVHSRWADHNCLVGQAGKNIRLIVLDTVSVHETHRIFMLQSELDT